jgi:hypothetical protein
LFTRLTFLLAISLCTARIMAGETLPADVIVSDLHTPQVEYAKRRLREGLAGAPGKPRRAHPAGSIDLVIDPALGVDAFRISPTERGIRIRGGDARGLIYGALEARQQLLEGKPPAKLLGRGDSPRLAFRGIKLNTPWDSYRPSSALDQHTATMKDLKFWEAYLDMMVENRFNAFTLWTMHPFTYLVRPKNFPEASKWTDAEFAQWQHLYREIFRMAKERGLDTYVVFWSIFVSEEFEKAHNPTAKNFYPHYYVDGDTSAVTKRYLRESVTQMLLEYPDLDGIGVSHGEGMAGMTPLQRQQFVDEVYIAGALEANKTRPVKLIHRVPFSSGLSSGPGVSSDVESLTRAAMEKLGNQFSGPIWVEMKFNWSHGHSTPLLVKVHGGKLGDTYFKPLPSNYRIVWQVRNEDFFALRWGDPSFIRDHIAINGKAESVGGYFVGSETYIPALDYFTAEGQPVPWKWAFERQWLFYKLWGRLLYDPATPDKVFESEFTRRYGSAGANLLQAYSRASQAPLLLARIYDSRWDFTLYAEGLLALQGEITKYIGVDALIEQPPLDPAYLSIKDFVKTLNEGRGFTSSQKTPLAVADWLRANGRKALELVDGINVLRNGDAALLYEVADVSIWAHIGFHLEAKIRGAVELHRYRTAGGEEHKQAAIKHLTEALAQWDEVIRLSRPLYKDMRLTHYNHNSFDANPDNLFHWALIRGEVAEDVEVARNAKGP